MECELSLNEIQLNTLEVLKEIKRIFNQNNWTYYLAYGTLIGAIRHNDFIPWDDDIDIYIPRKDYEEFIEYCISNSKLLGHFKLLHYKTNKKYPYVIGRFCDTRYTINYRGMKDYGLGLFVDLYPLDSIPFDDKKFRKKLNKMNIELLHITSTSKFLIKRIFYFLLKPVILMKNKCFTISQLEKKIDLLSQKYNNESNEYMDVFCWDFTKKDTPHKRVLFDGKLECQFNNDLFTIPQNYDAILKEQYGDYMKLPPEEDRIPHHYYTVYRK